MPEYRNYVHKHEYLDLVHMNTYNYVAVWLWWIPSRAAFQRLLCMRWILNASHYWERPNVKPNNNYKVTTGKSAVSRIHE